MSVGMFVVYAGGLAVGVYVLFLGRGALKAWRERKGHEIHKDQEAEPMILTTERVRMPMPDQQDKESNGHDAD